MTTQTNIEPAKLLDHIMAKFHLKNDAALANFLQIKPPIISKIRNRHYGMSADLLIRIHDLTDIPVRALRNIMGDYSPVYPISKPRASRAANDAVEVAA